MKTKNLLTITDIAKCYNNSEISIRIVLERIGDKWSMIVLLLLDEHGTIRFHEFDKIIHGISQKVLSNTLKALETDGLIDRKAYPVVPPKVEYTLTDLGRGLIPPVKTLIDWACEHSVDIVAARKNHNLNQGKF
ncbi:helix-turn-helix domain-containing protein [Chitinophaga sp.]|uniref:winged helix-turn-helix transcriptional regulator n=1 Tax=Chitinophaga sp. TaxID=1869181 RepID=UPI0031D185B9